jgi:pimeloyl-ACP methyl ester carboxylesterase
MLDGIRRFHLDLDTGVRIAVLDFGGSGRPALLHHANGFCAAVWGQVAEGLRDRFRLFAMDARGHGDSSKPEGGACYGFDRFGEDAGEVADRLAREHGPLALGLGHSFGGTALTQAAIADGSRFERLVIVEPIVISPGVPERPRRSRGPSLAEGARRRKSVFASREEAIDRWSGKSLFADWTPEALALYAQEGLAERADGKFELKCPPEVEASVFENGPGIDVMEAASRLETPTRILWAAKGNFPRSHFERLASRMQRGEVRDADAGHLVPMERPGLVIDEVLEFSARPGSPSRSTPSSRPEATPRG